MQSSALADFLWGKKAKLSYLLIAAIVLLFTCLAGREMWTQEHRWADIVAGMFFRNDFLHPYLGEARYYDKPLLSYWLIAGIAQLIGTLNMWALRLPSALAGVLAVWSIYRLGRELKDKQLGLLSALMLLTTFYFVFWARTSSADMLNLAGTLFAITWYREKRQHPSFFNYAVFFLILALTSLCKGLVGAVIPMLAVLVDVVLARSIKQHLRWSLFLGALPALVIYFIPFWASSHFGGEVYGQSGLYLVYRENVLRYFQPFDHQGPIYTYFIYLPIYLLPWTLFFIPALVGLKRRWKNLSAEMKWLTWTLFAIFIFFSVSGSRRSYYVLPLVPFAILFTADWILATFNSVKRWQASVAGVAIFSYLFILFALDFAPVWYYSQYGVSRFADSLKTEASKDKSWDSWHFVMLDAETKLIFYLGLPPTTKNYGTQAVREAQNTETLRKAWPLLTNKPANTIFVTRKRYVPLLASFFQDYRLFELPQQPARMLLKYNEENMPVAFIPLESTRYRAAASV
jgi:4-amino-4-deoxy-L-arabinose transferase-like glycosyltransferase